MVAGLAALVIACSGGPRPAAEPPSATPAEAPSTEPESQAQAPPQPAAEAPVLAEPRTPPPPVIIEPADPEAEAQPTLAEAARRERERRMRSGEPIAVINDANLREHAVGQLTFMEDIEPSPAATGDGGEAGDGDTGPDEQYWRDRVRGIRQRWSDAASAVPELEDRVAELRRQFYDTDDAYYRDSRIKPAWDRAIDLIAQTRAEAEAHRQELEKALEEGRLAGALPGWLREGVELEPAPPKPERDTHEPGEPVIVEPGEGGGG